MQNKNNLNLLEYKILVKISNFSLFKIILEKNVLRRV